MPEYLAELEVRRNNSRLSHHLTMGQMITNGQMASFCRLLLVVCEKENLLIVDNVQGTHITASMPVKSIEMQQGTYH